MTYGGGPEGGIVRLASSMTSTKLWYVWHRDWGRPASILRIPRELTPVSRHEDGFEAIKLVMDGDYELRENEYYLDDLDDNAEEREDSDSEYGTMNDDGDEGEERREDHEARWGGRQDEGDSETEADDDRREVINQLNHERQQEIAQLNQERQEAIEQLNQERRQEIASLTRELEDNNHTSYQQNTLDGVMTLHYVIHASQLRIAELKNEIALSRQ